MKRPASSLALFCFLLATTLSAQWSTENYPLKAGWNAIYPFIDASDITIESLLASEPAIEEVWRWEASAVAPLVLDEPSNPVTGAEWKVWRRSSPDTSSLDRLLPNYGYLIKVADGTSDFTLSLKGRTTLPAITWRKDGLNLVGFPASPSLGTVKIAPYLAPASILDLSTNIFRYIGGDLEDNPVAVAAVAFTDLPRGEAFWIDTARFSDYVSPVHVDIAYGAELDFGTRTTTRQLVLKNRSDDTVTITLTPTASETSRTGTRFTPVPLLERTVNPGTLNFEYTSIDAPLTIELDAGETLTKAIIADRRNFPSTPGTELASILEVTDSAGLSLIEVPVKAIVGDLGGLWVGSASIIQVQNQLQTFERDADGNYLYEEFTETYIDPITDEERTRQNERRIPLSGSTELASTAQTFPIRLLVHVDNAGQATLLSTLYFGPIEPTGNETEALPGLATSENLLVPERLDEASRLRAVHFPLDLDLALNGSFTPGTTLTGLINLAYDDPENPFVHTYHPDHDNLDVRFENVLPAGEESFNVARSVSLQIDLNGGDGSDPSWGSDIITGRWVETISGLHKNDLTVEGPFTLQRLSELKTLHRP